ncbi:canopy-1 [Chlorella sorokiniana]|uniref:Canopy-1 n=1 Tax=Chlorella sorokiniana TaxID=3076 RepID=A0A2P6TYU5_CHLSO|nr:canopy-1 [Chlorella sorokiniana]|eukprot:PRW59238.1 canopy-1 [Chlorella sorokiniana]
MGTARPARAAGALVPLLLLLICGAAASLAAGEPTRCSACRAVAEELIARLDAEQPRNHIDLQHRVGPDGKRWGKVIEYKISELRVIHLLEDLCDGMDSYEIASDAAGQRWARSDSLDGSAGLVTSEKPRKEQRRQLGNFCHDVIERHEDALSLALRNGEVSSDNASDFLCVKAASLCQQTLAEEQAAAAAARAAAEEAARAATAEKEAAAAAEKEAAAASADAGKEGQQAEGGAEAQQAEEEPEAGGAAAAAAGGDAMQEARSEL